MSPGHALDDPGKDPALRRAEFERQVHDALGHLYDPAYLQTHPLARFAQPDVARFEPIKSDGGGRSPSLGRALSQSLLDAIEALRPPSTPTQSPHVSRTYEILRLRFVEALDVPEIESRLAISRSVYYGEQQRAIKAVAALLWREWVGKEWVEGGGADLTRSSQPLRLVDRDRGPRHNLPLQLTSFVGREREMADVRRLLGRTRLLTLTGTGGCGKTRLAYQVAADLREEYPDGVWAVELAALSDPSLVAQTVAFALEVREQPGQAILATLQWHLKPRQLLLVLDNCEHLLDACAILADALLRGCPRLRILATSREALGIAGENSYRVPSLSLPDPRDLPPIASLLQYEAVRLFVERAVAAMPSFALADQSAPSVAQICSRLDGMPLALELAAARVRGLGVEGLAARLDDRFRLLTGGSRTALRRQQTLRATIDWSYDLLTEPERVLFRRLAVFAGGWTLEAAEAVCASGEVEEGEVVDLLLRLVDRSLVVAESEREPVRYRLLETIRQYAQERLFESGEVAAVRDRHLERCLAFAERAAFSVRSGDDRPIWRTRAEREHDNLRAALDWSLARDEAADTPIRLAASVVGFWAGTELREQMLPVLARAGGDSRARFEVLRAVANTEGIAGHWRIARERSEEALALARETGDKRLIARAVVGLGFVAMNRGEIAESIALQTEALGLAQKCGARELSVGILFHLAMMHLQAGHGAAARPLAEEALAISREIDDPSQTIRPLLVLGWVLLSEGDLESARMLVEEGLARAREVGSDETLSLASLGDVARAEGDMATAEALYQEVLEAFQEPAARGQGLIMTAGLVRLAGIWVVRGRPRQAAPLFGAVRGWLESVGLPAPWGPTRSYERDEAAAREALGEEAFARAFAEGQAMTLEQAVEYALSDAEA